MNNLHEFSENLAAAADAASKYVVAVQAGTRFGASGVVWQPGVAVTTRSTLRREDNIRLILPGSEEVTATLAGHDPGTDIAVLRFEGESAVRGEFASDPLPGHVALAVGRSEATGANVALGVVSAIGKPWQTWQGGKLDRYIRLDINLYSGGSGAAVVDTHGRLIGIASGVLSRIAPLAITSGDAGSYNGRTAYARQRIPSVARSRRAAGTDSTNPRRSGELDFRKGSWFFPRIPARPREKLEFWSATYS